MRRLPKVVLPAIGAGALVMASATSAFAATTTITSNGSPYSGDVVATNLTNITLSGSTPVGTFTTTCTHGELDANVQSDGTGGSMTGAVMDNGGTPCKNNFGGNTTITALNLPYSPGSAVYDPAHTNNRDGYIQIPSPNAAVDIKAVATTTFFGTVTCHYGLTSSTPSLTLDLFNGSNPNRPITSNPHGQGTLNGQQLKLDSTKSNSFLCPSATTGTATFQVLTAGGADLEIGP